MSNQIYTLKASGLQTFFQSLMEVPPGGLLKATNTVIDREGVISPRRGFTTYSSQLNDPIKQLLEYKKKIIRHVGTKLSYDNGFGNFTEFEGDYEEADSRYRLKSTEFKSNLYFCDKNGVKKISAKSSSDFSTSGVIRDCGAPKAISGTLQLNGSSGFLVKGTAVSYRVVWLYTDNNDNLILGAPSSSMTINNTSDGDRDVELTFQIPYNVTSLNFKYRIYRSEMSTFGTPSDETYQVYEASITSTELTNRKVIIVDSLPESLRIGGIPLYTNQYSGEGILNSNEPPPVAKDIAIFQNHMFYANTRTRHRAILTLKTVAGFTAGVSDLVINGVVYTFDSFEDVVLKKVKLGTVEETIRSLVKTINSDPSESISAYYLSNIGDSPGKFLLEKKTLEDNVFYVGTNDPSITINFTPEIGTGGSLSTKVTSTSEAYSNRIYYSKFLENEAVPLTNYLDVGGRDSEIKRILPFRDALYIFKEDGIFKMTGEGSKNPSWSVDVHDNTSFLRGADTLITLGNQCYYFSNQGVVRLNESDSTPISKPIQNKLLPFLTTSPSIEQASFCLPYESDKSLLLFTVKKDTDTIATICYRYNINSNSWTDWKISKTCGIVSTHLDRLYLGSSDNYVEIERKNFDRFDYADRELTTQLTVNQLQENVIGLPIFQSLDIGDVILQKQYVTITEINCFLKHLDLDPKLKATNFYNELKMSIGDNLTQTMVLLRDKLRIADPAVDWSGPDINGNLDYEFVPSTTDFLSIQNQFNYMIDRLNTSPNTFLKNYRKSENVKVYEASITELNNLTFNATLNIAPAFIQGNLTIYKGIFTEIEYAPQHADSPESFKQFSTGTFMFERRSFYQAEVSYNSDISDNFEKIPVYVTSSGVFGGTTWGDGTVFGGSGDQAQIRTYIPLKKQRCRFLGCKFIHKAALESFNLYGISLTVRRYAISDRDYK